MFDSVGYLFSFDGGDGFNKREKELFLSFVGIDVTPVVFHVYTIEALQYVFQQAILDFSNRIQRRVVEETPRCLP